MPKSSMTARQLSAVDRNDRGPNLFDSNSIAQICRELEALGVEPMLPVVDAERLASGVTLSVDAVAALASEPAMEQFREQVIDVLASGLPLSVSAQGLGPEPWAAARFSRLCEILQAAASAAQANPRGIEIVIDADTLAPDIAWQIRHASLSDGPTYFRAGATQMCTHDDQGARERHDRFWFHLWRLRKNGMVRAAVAPLVSPQCALLCTEAAAAISPLSGIQIPAGSAWVTMNLNLSRFADDRGSLREGELQNALQCCVDLGDALHDHLVWPTAQMRHDGWLNRRLAIVLTGLGDVALQRGLDPQQFTCLQSLGDMLRWVLSVLRTRSRDLAAKSENLPAIALCDPSQSLPNEWARDSWRDRWRHAVDLNAIRHRNLVVLSPWSLFPEHGPADPRYSDLLPLLEFADACAFADPPALERWNINQFISLHKILWAVLEQKEARQLIAERV